MVYLQDKGPENPEEETEVRETVDDMLKNIINDHKKIYKPRNEDKKKK